MKTRIFPGATENEKAIFAFLLASLEIHGADSAEMFEGIEESHGMREGIAEYEYGRNGRINLRMMIHF